MTVNRPKRILLSAICTPLLFGIAGARQSTKPSPFVRGQEIRSELHLTGNQRLHGTNQKFEMHITKDFKFLVQAQGELPEQDGYDGITCWHLGGSGVPHISSYSDRDLTRMVAYVQSGVWACKGSPVEIVSEKGNELVIKCRDGNTTANLTVNSDTGVAKTLSTWGSSGTESWTFSNYKNSAAGIPVPTTIQHTSGESNDVTTVDQLALPSPQKLNFSMPSPTVTGFTFDQKANPNIEVKRMYGYLFVKPKIDGKDEGWWFLDTGAEIMVIDPAVARSHNMRIVGKDAVSGVVASITTNFSKGVEFNLGPITIRNSSYMELDMKPFSDGLGIKLAGICGYDFISRGILDIDPQKPTIGIFPFETKALPEKATWMPFLFHGNLPALPCQFEGKRTGLFSLDTGSGSTVDFFSPAVTKFDLLKNRKLQAEMTGGAGGTSESKSGKIEWFDLGGKRFENPRVGFQTTTKGGFASPYVDGNIGMGFMGNFRMILDYQSSRLCFIESKTP